MHKTKTVRRQAIRAALRIHDQLAGALPAVSELPQAAWEELRHTVALLQRARERGWRVAIQQLLEDLDYSLQRMSRELYTYRQGLSVSLRSERRSAPSEILADIEVLGEEFDDVELDLQQAKLSVRTGPIELEDVYLGPFQIELAWEKIGRGQAYQVIAVDPHPPSGESDTTHPHVRGDELCVGEGALPVKAALAQGRILDFFVLVRQVLETYNPSSAYVALDRWHGIGCRDCGWRMSSDDYSTCDRCDAALCGDCSGSCGGCDRLICGSCSTLCAQCENSFCRNCLARQGRDGRLRCESCLEINQENESDETVEIPAADGAIADGPENETCPPEPTAAADAICFCEARLLA